MSAMNAWGVKGVCPGAGNYILIGEYGVPGLWLLKGGKTRYVNMESKVSCKEVIGLWVHLQSHLSSLISIEQG
jgi:hypothetical protein